MLDETSAMDLTMKHFEELELFGIGVRIDSKLEGIAIGCPMTGTMFLEGFEKANHTIIGLYQYVLNAFVKRLPMQYTELNREEDLGLEALRQTKEQWNPIYLINKYQL